MGTAETSEGRGAGRTAVCHGQVGRVIHTDGALESGKLDAARLLRWCGLWCGRGGGVVADEVDHIVVEGALTGIWKKQGVLVGGLVHVELDLLRLRHKELFLAVLVGRVVDEVDGRRRGLEAGAASAAWRRGRYGAAALVDDGPDFLDLERGRPRSARQRRHGGGGWRGRSCEVKVLTCLAVAVYSKCHTGGHCQFRALQGTGSDVGPSIPVGSCDS